LARIRSNPCGDFLKFFETKSGLLASDELNETNYEKIHLNQGCFYCHWPAASRRVCDPGCVHSTATAGQSAANRRRRRTSSTATAAS
jgi:hypothetical protein